MTIETQGVVRGQLRKSGIRSMMEEEESGIVEG